MTGYLKLRFGWCLEMLNGDFCTCLGMVTLIILAG